MKRFNVFIVLIVVSLSLSACGGGGGGGDSVTSLADPLIGTYFRSATLVGGDYYYSAIEVKPDNNIIMVEMVMPSGSTTQVYFQKSIGTYIKTGDTLNIAWNYETCNHFGTETVQVSATDPSDRIFITKGITTIQMLNTKKWLPNVDLANSYLVMTEDVNCNPRTVGYLQRVSAISFTCWTHA